MFQGREVKHFPIAESAEGITQSAVQEAREAAENFMRDNNLDPATHNICFSGSTQAMSIICTVENQQAA